MVTRNIYTTFRTAVLLTSILCLALGLIPVLASVTFLGHTTNNNDEVNSKCTPESTIYNSLKFSFDGKKLAFSKVVYDSDYDMYRSCLLVFDIQSGKQLLEIMSQTDQESELSIFSVAFTQDSAGLVFNRRIRTSTSNRHEEQQIEVWNIATGRREQLIAVDFAVQDEMVDKLVVVPGSPLLFLNTSSYAFAYDLKAKSVKHKFPALLGTQYERFRMEVHPTGNYVLTYDEQNGRSLWDVNTGQLIRTFPCIGSSFLPAAPTVLLSACSDAEAIIWDYQAKREVWRTTSKSVLVSSTVSSDGKIGLGGDAELNSFLFDVTTQQILERFRTNGDGFNTEAFVQTTNGDVFITIDNTDQKVELRAWSTKDRKWLKTFGSYKSDRELAIFATANQGEFALKRTSESTYTSWIELWRVTDNKPYATFR